LLPRRFVPRRAEFSIKKNANSISIAAEEKAKKNDPRGRLLRTGVKIQGRGGKVKRKGRRWRVRDRRKGILSGRYNEELFPQGGYSLISLSYREREDEEGEPIEQ